MTKLLNQLFFLLLIAIIKYPSASYADYKKACRNSKDCVEWNHCGGSFHTLYVQSCCVDGWCKCKETNRYSPYCPDYEIETVDEFHYFCEAFDHVPWMYELEWSVAQDKCFQFLRKNKERIAEIVRDPGTVFRWRLRGGI